MIYVKKQKSWDGLIRSCALVLVANVRGGSGPSVSDLKLPKIVLRGKKTPTNKTPQKAPISNPKQGT